MLAFDPALTLSELGGDGQLILAEVEVLEKRAVFLGAATRMSAPGRHARGQNQASRPLMSVNAGACGTLPATG